MGKLTNTATMENVDIYIIYCHDERYSFMKTQMEKFGISCTFVKAAIPETSSDWLGTDPTVPDKLKCCCKSHIDTMKLWLSSASHASYLLILEDDVCLLNADFLNKLQNVISVYSATPEIDYVSIGYLPHTINKGLLHSHLHKFTHSRDNLYWGVSKLDFTVWGSQAQLFTKATVQKIVDLLDVRSADEIYSRIGDYLKTHPIYQDKVLHPMIDVLLPLLFSQAIVCPPLAIENDMPSSIHNDSERRKIWTKADSEKMLRIADYYSY